MPENPFVWVEAVKDGVPRKEFSSKVAQVLRGGTHVALFGPRGTGKTTFLGELGRELAAGRDEWNLLTIDLRRAISLQAFAHAVLTALNDHPSRKVRRKARAVLGVTEGEIALNLGFVKAGIRGPNRHPLGDGELLFTALRAASEVSEHVVIAFDEFQRLAACPGEPLSILRSALMGPERHQHVSLLLTGSLRERLHLMLHTSTEPIWDQTYDLDLPELDSPSLIEYLERKFFLTKRPIDEYAAEDIVAITDGHPKRTQQLAWQVWDKAQPESTIQREDVYGALDDLLLPEGPLSSDFERLIDTFLNGSEGEVNNARALFLLAADEDLSGRDAATLYGLTHPTTTSRALARLKERGFAVQTANSWKLVDPFLAIWLKRQNPFLPSVRSTKEVEEALNA